MSDAQKAFDPTDPFDVATEDLRKAIALAVAFHMDNHPLYQKLEPQKRVESVLIATLITTVGCTSAFLKPGSDAMLTDAIHKYLPTAFEYAHEITANGEAKLAAQEMKH